MDAPKPIGYWLKHLHNLLETLFEQALSDFAVNRRKWQLLSALSDGPHTFAELGQALAPFWPGPDPDPREDLAGLVEQGWTCVAGDVVTLTESGRARHTELAEQVERMRAVVIEGLTPQQYAETMRNLQVMAGNIEAALASRSVRTQATA